MWPNPFLVKKHNFCGGRKWITSVLFKKLPKENNHPTGENSPNLVTLIAIPSRSI
jgi:hypothetical protein